MRHIGQRAPDVEPQSTKIRQHVPGDDRCEMSRSWTVIHLILGDGACSTTRTRNRRNYFEVWMPSLSRRWNSRKDGYGGGFLVVNIFFCCCLFSFELLFRCTDDLISCPDTLIKTGKETIEATLSMRRILSAGFVSLGMHCAIRTVLYAFHFPFIIYNDTLSPHRKDYTSFFTLCWFYLCRMVWVQPDIRLRCLRRVA